jgi:hypothetical protein
MKSKQRGFVLMDALFGAGVTASMMTAMIVQVGAASTAVVKQERERSAQSLVYEGYERMRADGYDGLPAVAGVLADEPSLRRGAGTYLRTTTLTAAGTESFGAFGDRTVQLPFKEVEIVVQFPVNVPAAQRTTLAQRFRIYRT